MTVWSARRRYHCLASLASAAVVVEMIYLASTLNSKFAEMTSVRITVFGIVKLCMEHWQERIFGNHSGWKGVLILLATKRLRPHTMPV